MHNKRRSEKHHWEKYWAERQNIGEVYSNAGRIVSQIQNFISVKNKRILEIGAGTGRDGLRLINSGARVFLLDYAEQSLSIMKELAAREGLNVILIKGDALALPFKNESFDVVWTKGCPDRGSARTFT